jgi:hypothetical protein
VTALVARLLRAVWLVSWAGLLLTGALAAVFTSHVLFGLPPTLVRLPWLVGPRWLVVVGLALQAFVLVELVRVSGRRLRRLRRDRPGPGGG